MRMASEALPNLDISKKALEEADFSLLRDDTEINLIKEIAAWPRILENAADAHEPHRLAFYLYELASAFHALWTKGSRENPLLRIVREDDPDITIARLALAQGTRTVIASGLNIFGVEAVKEMR